MANRPPDDLRQTFLTIVDEARQDTRMAESLPPGHWKKTLNNIYEAIAEPISLRPGERTRFLRYLINPQLTDEINRRISSFDDSSLLAPARKQLGIESRRDENPFRVVAVDVNPPRFRNGAHTNSRESQLRRDAWRLVADYAQDMAHAFAFVDPSEAVPTIYLFHDTATRLLDGHGNQPLQLIADDGQPYADTSTPLDVLLHEYRHLQRGLDLKEAAVHVGIIPNEMFANGGALENYSKTQRHLIGASIITGQNLAEPMWNQTINETPSSYYRGLVKQVGPSQALLWSLMKPNGIAPQPELWPWPTQNGIGVNKLMNALVEQEVSKRGERTFDRQFKSELKRVGDPALKASSFSQFIQAQAPPRLEALFTEAVLDRGVGL